MVVFFILLALVSYSLSLQVLSPEDIEGEYSSAFITFNKQTSFSEFTGRAQFLLLEESGACKLPSNMLPATTAPIAVVRESNVKKACDQKMELFYQQLENVSFVAAIVGAHTFYVPGEALGYAYGMDVNSFSIGVTYLSADEFDLLYNSLLTNQAPMIVSLDTDLGSFYRLSVSGGFNVFRFGVPCLYFMLVFLSFFLLYVEWANKGLVLNILVGITICTSLLCLVRGIKIAAQEDEDYYLFEPKPRANLAISGVLLWFPFVVGTTAYTFTAYAWIALISSIERNNFIYKIRKPLFGFFIFLIPLSILLPALDIYVNVYSFIILCICIVIVGIFETAIFTVYGIKILRHMTTTSAQLRTEKTVLEKKLTLFILGAIFCWIIMVIISGLYVVIQLQPQSYPRIFPLAVLRDVFILSLTAMILLFLIRKKDIKSTRSKNASNPKLPHSRSAVSGLSVDPPQEP